MDSSEIKVGEKLTKPNILMVVGLGGIGSWVVEPILRYLHSQHALNQFDVLLIDGDEYDAGNADRQIVHPKLIGMNKATATAMRLRGYFPEVSFIEYPAFIDIRSLKEDIFTTRRNTRNNRVFCLSCVDNHECRLALQTFMFEHIRRFALLTGGNELEDGNVHIFVRNGFNFSPSLVQSHPEVSEGTGKSRREMSCEELAALPSGGQVVATNFMCAAQMVQIFYNLWKVKDKLDDFTRIRDIYFDTSTMATNAVKY